MVAQESDTQCTQDSIVTNVDTIVANKANGEKVSVGLSSLARSRYPDGGKTLNDLDIIWDFNCFQTLANVITENLDLATSGPLEGKYLFLRTRHILRDYLKKCSSVLGYSYVTYKSIELLICDKLSPKALINPSGTYEALKKEKRCTLCQGNGYGV